MNIDAYRQGYRQACLEAGVDPGALTKAAQEMLGTTAMPWEERLTRSLANLPVISQLGGADYNIKGAKELFAELGLDEDQLSWAVRNPLPASFVGSGLGALGLGGLGALQGYAMSRGRPESAILGGLLGGGVGAVLGSTLPGTAAVDDIARADNLVLQEMRKEQMRR